MAGVLRALNRSQVVNSSNESRLCHCGLELCSDQEKHVVSICDQNEVPP